MWKGIEGFFYYTRSQRNGIFVLIVVIVFLQLFLYVDDFFFKPPPVDPEELRHILTKWKNEDDSTSLSPEQQIKFFSFNPNTTTIEEFQLLGLSPKQAQTISNYRNRGGDFYQKEDLLKIYGMDTNWYQKAIPYIEISESKTIDPKKAKVFDFKRFDPNIISKEELQNMGLQKWQAYMIETYRTKVKPFQKPEELYKVYGLDSDLVEKMLYFVELGSLDLDIKKKPEEVVMVEINSADTTELMKLRGISSSYVYRIVKYRDLLGGYIDKEQLLEVYGMTEKQYQLISKSIKLDSSKIKKLNINTATFKALLQHPYLSYEVVQNIVNFRDNVRLYRNVEELKNIELIDEDLMNRVASYLSVNNEVESER